MLYGDGNTNALTDQVIACAIEVHRELGPGLLESVYERALCLEFNAAGIDFKRQVGIPLFYKGELLSEHRPDLIVGDRVIVEVKSVETLNPVHTAQLLTYLRVCRVRVGLILNFNSAFMRHGIRRLML
jgi:GxxExxY protein